ncbi:putative ABC transporter ATP-binding protein [Anaerolineae bacterium]|nr:putative ABC transporter ATP-binding protein [Anaerolineae bacterium]
MGFLMDGLDAEGYDRKYADGDLVRRIIRYFKPQSQKMTIVGVLVLLSSLSSTALPVVISRGLDAIQADPRDAIIVTVAALAVGVGVLGWLFNFVRRWYSSQAIGDVVLKLREDAFEAVLRRDLSFFDAYPSGKIVSRVTSDTHAFSQVVNLVMELVSQILLVGLLLIYLTLVDAQLTLVLILMIPVIMGVALAFRKIARVTVTQSRRARAEVSALIQESVAGIGVAKTFRQETSMYGDFLGLNRRSFRINLRTGYVFTGIFPILNVLAGIGTAGLVFFGGRGLVFGTLTAGDYFLFIQGMLMFWFPLTSIASFWSQFQLGLAAGERVFSLIDDDPKVRQTGSTVLKTIKGAITFENLSFRYTDKEQVLDNFSLRINAGESVALVGHTGAGKSSIGKLIARFYEFQSGRILIDGVDIRSLDLQAFRRHLGVVTQTPFLFDGTVADNIRYGRREATDAEVERAARQIANGDWLDTLPAGLETTVGERGSSLSMGQRQLVALARIMLQNPSIIILDEATASVDPMTEALIQEGLDAVLKGRTSIVIAHRLSTIRNVDRIIVLKQGQIIEEGSHDSLMANGGHYAELYNTYFRHQSIQYIEASKYLLEE